MKSFLLLISLCICGITNATNYYFSTSIGDDTRTNIQAQNPATPWKSIAKLNSFFSSLTAGDSVLFKRGEIFYGSILINKSGTTTSPIKISAYGSGANPIITGLTAVAGWRNLGSNIWESTAAVSTLPTCMMVVVNGINTPMGRYPNVSSTVVTGGIHPVPGNNGWLNYESSVGTNQITDDQLAATPNWTGASVVIKKYNWVVDVGTITSHVGTVINYSPTATESGFVDAIPGMSYFFQNDIRTLDELNEWYYNPTTKKLTIYSVSSPTGVQVATVQNVINTNSKNYISFSNLDIQGSNSDLILPTFNTTGLSITNCGIYYAGRDGLFTHSPTNFIINGNSIHDINNNGIMIWAGANTVSINNNTVYNVGIYPGMTDQSKNFSMEGLHCIGDNVTFQGNRISHIGNNGIRFEGDNVYVQKNFVEDYCIVKTDGAGIYTWGVNGAVTHVNQIIEDNIIVNGSNLGHIGTWLEQEQLSVNGIYLDGTSQNVMIRRNSISHVNASGVYMNTPINVTVRDNSIYDCRYSAIHANKDAGSPNLNLVVKNNICVAKLLATQPTNSYQRCFYYLSDVDDITLNIVADSNIYARPIDNDANTPPPPGVTNGSTGWGNWGTMSKVVYSNYTGPGEPGIQTTYTLAGWKAAYPTFEQHSKKSPKAISSVYDLRFEYNETTSAKTINLGANYIDMKGIAYAGTITLQSNTSIVLIKNDATNIPPVANAGADQSYSTPITSTSIIGSGVDYDGTIAGYNWAKISGPTAGTISSPNSATTSATGLVQGVYKFELKVTDNKGATGKDTLTVNIGSIIVPVTLINFSAIAKSGKTLLQWTTATEINSSHFEVERSIDGNNFTAIGTVLAGGNTNIRIDYQLTDNFPESGINYYRLKIVDKDGQYEYSRIVSVNFKNSNTESIEIRSSMINNNQLQMNINSTLQQSAVLGLYTADGKAILISNLILQKGMNNINKEVNLASAIYYCRLITTDKKYTISLLSGH